jgi:methyl-accepting chemotaxis protein
MADSMTGIVELIQDIASQINLLSLNATIESARAGEAGKGFAVVASEVKNLANQVGQAIQQISQDIEGMQTVSSEVVESLHGIRSTFKAVKDRITDVAGAVEEQSAATGELANNMQVASSAVEDITSNLVSLAEAIDGATGFAQQGIDMYRALQR